MHDRHESGDALVGVDQVDVSDCLEVALKVTEGLDGLVDGGDCGQRNVFGRHAASGGVSRELQQIFDLLKNNPNAQAQLRAPIFEEKVVDYIVELAKPEERKVSPEQLLALSEADEAEEATEKKPAEKKPRRQAKAPRAASRPRKGAKE